MQKRPWLAQEIDRLYKAVQEHGRNWVAVSSSVGNGRSNDDCRCKAELEMHACRMKDPRPKRVVKKSRPWTTEEIIQLNEAVVKYGRDWSRYGICTRTNKECMRKVQSLVNSGMMQDPPGKRRIRPREELPQQSIATSIQIDARRDRCRENDSIKCKIKICSERRLIGSRYCSEHKFTSFRYNRQMADDYADPYMRNIRKCKIQGCQKNIKREGFCVGHHPIKRIYTCRKCFSRSTTSTPRDGLCKRCVASRPKY